MASSQCTRAFSRPLSFLNKPALVPSRTTLPTTRPFSSTPITPVKAKQAVAGRYSAVPPYPYVARLWYKKSNYGLYGLAMVRFGNNVSARNEIKTRRRWYPNVHRKRLWSVALGRFVRTRVTTRVLRTIDKVGGLDEYLLGEKAGRVKELGPGGWALRWRIMRTDAVRERLRAERVRLGLEEGEEGVGEFMDETVEMEGLREEDFVETERAIDRILDEDEARAERGEDGGVELEALDEMVEEKVASKPAQKTETPVKRKW